MDPVDTTRVETEETLEEKCVRISSEKDERVFNNIVNRVLDRVSEKYDELYNRNLFECWFSYGDAEHEFWYIYEKSYKEEFEFLMNNSHKNDFYLMAKNISYFIQTLSFKNKKTLLEKLKIFVKLQLQDADNWCEIHQKCYEYLREHNGILPPSLTQVQEDSAENPN
jgi:hypothetical protein